MTDISRCKERKLAMGDFEKDLELLEDITHKLQSGELGIEKSMDLYAKGNKLADELKKKLETYQSKIEILSGEVKDK
jgi:exodeoxyribonuclease VII small subunit